MVMPIDPNKVDRDLIEIEGLINKLALEWDKYFGGGSRVPPLQFQKQIDERLKAYRDTSELSYSQNFKLSTIQGKYTSSKDKWDKQLRIKEEGYVPGIKTATKSTTATKPITVSMQQETKAAKAVSPATERGAGTEKSAPARPYQDLFEQYVEARKKCGEPVEQLKYESFSDTIEKQKKQIIEKVKGRQVEFYVTVEEGKTKLKARPSKN